MNRAAILAAVILGLLAGAYALGHRQATAAFQARLDRAAAAAQAQAAETAKALAVAEQERARLSQALEDAANADPVTSAACLPVGRVMRLNSQIPAKPAALR